MRVVGVGKRVRKGKPNKKYESIKGESYTCTLAANKVVMINKSQEKGFWCVHSSHRRGTHAHARNAAGVGELCSMRISYGVQKRQRISYTNE